MKQGTIEPSSSAAKIRFFKKKKKKKDLSVTFQELFENKIFRSKCIDQMPDWLQNTKENKN